MVLGLHPSVPILHSWQTCLHPTRMQLGSCSGDGRERVPAGGVVDDEDLSMPCTWCRFQMRRALQTTHPTDQGMSSCGPSVGIICIPPPPPSMHRIARFDCHPHAVFQQLLPSTCAEEFETFPQFLFAHMTTSWGLKSHSDQNRNVFFLHS